jgi:hypothetical protein
MGGIISSGKVGREHRADFLVVVGFLATRRSLGSGPFAREPDSLAAALVVCARLSDEPIELRIFPPVTIKRRAVDKPQRPIYRAPPTGRPCMICLIVAPPLSRAAFTLTKASGFMMPP